MEPPFVQNPDGSITRTANFATDSPASEDHGNPYPTLSRDVPINQEKRTWARIYIPKTMDENTKLPLVIYFHGGGFVVFSAASSMFQGFCAELTSRTPAVMVSVDYRLAPEHRLPAAYDDCLEAVEWIETAEEEWLAKYADFSKCFLMGSSAGGNIAYHVGLRAAARAGHRLKNRGLILHQPYFGGVERTPSETKLIDDSVLPLHAADMMWGFALPIGADRDHGYCNFTAKSYSDDVFEKIKEEGWKVMVTGCDGDPLVDRQRQLVEVLGGRGVEVVAEFAGGGCHGVELFDGGQADVFYGLVKTFIHSLSSAFRFAYLNKFA